MSVLEDGSTEIHTQECWFYEGKLCFDYECCGEHTVEDICEVVSEDPDLIADLESIFESKTLSGTNPLDYLEEEDFDL